jgi:hypothetical protein
MDKRIIIGVGIGCALGCVVAIIVAGVAGGAFVAWLAEEPEQVVVDVDLPVLVTKGESFVIEVQIENTAPHAQVLDSIDIGVAYLDGIAIQGTEPAFVNSSRYTFLEEFQSYDFQQNIPPAERLQVQFYAVAAKPGDFSSDLDVCINDGANCLTFPVRTVVED